MDKLSKRERWLVDKALATGFQLGRHGTEPLYATSVAFIELLESIATPRKKTGCVECCGDSKRRYKDGGMHPFVCPVCGDE